MPRLTKHDSEKKHQYLMNISKHLVCLGEQKIFEYTFFLTLPILILSVKKIHQSCRSISTASIKMATRK